MSWSAEQLRLLRALGHEPMRLATPADFATAASHPAGAAVSRDTGVAGDERPSRQNAAPTNDGARLLAEIARAAGGRDLAALALDLERLRREPALKRALWPRLRALRREH
jgi:hypothetical protein